MGVLALTFATDKLLISLDSKRVVELQPLGVVWDPDGSQTWIPVDAIDFIRVYEPVQRLPLRLISTLWWLVITAGGTLQWFALNPMIATWNSRVDIVFHDLTGKEYDLLGKRLTLGFRNIWRRLPDRYWVRRFPDYPSVICSRHVFDTWRAACGRDVRWWRLHVEFEFLVGNDDDRRAFEAARTRWNRNAVGTALGLLTITILFALIGRLDATGIQVLGFVMASVAEVTLMMTWLRLLRRSRAFLSLPEIVTPRDYLELLERSDSAWYKFWA